MDAKLTIIPAFNGGATVADVVGAALGANPGLVMVIDDGRRDDTALRTQKKKKASGKAFGAG